MFEKVTPESVGVSSGQIKKYISLLEKAHLSTHSVLMMRHGKIFYENYWSPFHADFLHRVYSVSKSFVSIAIGFLWQDGKINLDEKAVTYLDSETTKNANEYVKEQTIRNMLMMATGMPTASYETSWFATCPEDNVREYFDASGRGGTSKIPGTIFDYDSHGSFILGAIVEIVSGKSLMDFLREKLFDKIGFSKEAYCLTRPGGHSWGDSAILCTARDLALMIQFLLNKGKWNGEQILSEQYVEEATSNLIDTDVLGHLLPSHYGYGYQIWRTRGNSFYFNGMGNQFAIGIPDKDMVFVINADNQGHPAPDMVIIDRFFEEIVDLMEDEPLSENPQALSELDDFSGSLTLFSFEKGIEKNFAEKISGKEFIMNQNPMGIKKMKFTFEGDEGRIDYINAQGEKTLYFGVGKNVFGVFPQEGYSDLVGNIYAEGNFYKCAASAMWTHERNLAILVQIIDKYFGRLHMRISFTNDNRISVFMDKIAEAFLNEYEGYAEGTAC